MIPYGRQYIDDDDIQAVVDVLHSDWLTTGPAVGNFEKAVSEYCGASHGVAVANGTAALHAALYAAGIGPGDEVITTPITFVATANAALFLGATPIFADVSADTLLIDPAQIEQKLTGRTRAVIAVDYAGQPCDYDALQSLCRRHGLFLIADACHSIGATHNQQKVGTLADFTVFSFHPVKNITTGEGGMILTEDQGGAETMRRFRSHGIDIDFRGRQEKGSWQYAMKELGYNYRLSDIHCALGISQLKKLDQWIERRNQLAGMYDKAFADTPFIRPLHQKNACYNAFHLYVVRVPSASRKKIFAFMRENGIGVNVHYIPVHLHPFYREQLGCGPGLCPVAEAAYEEILSLPMHPGLSETQIHTVAQTLIQALQ